MVTYRHKILWNRLRNKVRDEDIEGIKLAGLFIALLFIIGFFGYRILNTISSGLEAEQRIQNIESQLSKLESDNKVLKLEKEAALSDSELEAQYRSLGYKKSGETVYLIHRDSLPTNTPTPSLAPEESKYKLQNWEKWFLKIFD